MSRHKCLRRGCTVLVDEGALACERHWLELPEWQRQRQVDALARHGQASQEYGDEVSVTVAMLRRGPA